MVSNNQVLIYISSMLQICFCFFFLKRQKYIFQWTNSEMDQHIYIVLYINLCRLDWRKKYQWKFFHVLFHFSTVKTNFLVSCKVWTRLLSTFSIYKPLSKIFCCRLIGLYFLYVLCFFGDFQKHWEDIEKFMFKFCIETRKMIWTVQKLC